MEVVSTNDTNPGTLGTTESGISNLGVQIANAPATLPSGPLTPQELLAAEQSDPNFQKSATVILSVQRNGQETFTEHGGVIRNPGLFEIRLAAPIFQSGPGTPGQSRFYTRDSNGNRVDLDGETVEEAELEAVLQLSSGQLTPASHRYSIEQVGVIETTTVAVPRLFGQDRIAYTPPIFRPTQYQTEQDAQNYYQYLNGRIQNYQAAGGTVSPYPSPVTMNFEEHFAELGADVSQEFMDHIRELRSGEVLFSATNTWPTAILDIADMANPNPSAISRILRGEVTTDDGSPIPDSAFYSTDQPGLIYRIGSGGGSAPDFTLEQSPDGTYNVTGALAEQVNPDVVVDNFFDTPLGELDVPNTDGSPGTNTTSRELVIESLGSVGVTGDMTVGEAVEQVQQSILDGSITSNSVDGSLNSGGLIFNDPRDVFLDLIQGLFDIHQHGGGVQCLDCHLRAHTGGSYSWRNQGASFNGFIEATARNGSVAEGNQTFMFAVPQSVDSPPPGVSPIPYYLTRAEPGGGTFTDFNGQPIGSLRPGQVIETVPFYRDLTNPDDPHLYFPTLLRPDGSVEMPAMSIPERDLPALYQSGLQSGGLRLEDMAAYILPSQVPYMEMRGLERDLQSMHQILFDVTEENAAGISRIHYGLVSGDPSQPNAADDFFLSLAYLQKWESETGRQLGGIGVGETTIAKEGVIPYLIDESAIDLNDPADLSNIKNYFDQVGETGAVIVLHADVGTTAEAETYLHDPQGNILYGDDGQPLQGNRIMIGGPSDNANVDQILDVVQSTDSNVIWAHFGGIGRTQTPTVQHLNMLDTMLS